MAGSGDDNQQPKKPPYARYAFRNPYNLALVGGIASAAALTGNWWLGVAAAGFEALWMLFAPDSKLLRKVWFDKIYAAEIDAAKRKELDAKFRSLPESDAMRCSALKEKQEQIHSLATGNPSFTVDLLSGEL